MFAIVDIAGFQEMVKEGDTLLVPTLDVEPGKTITFDSVLLVSDGGSSVTIGTPTVDGASVTAKVIEHGRYDKIRVFKMKKRKRYRRTHGHKQGYTEIEITKISASDAKVSKVKSDAVKEKVSAKKETK
jgi:large subunit ribosomal protein L21